MDMRMVGWTNQNSKSFTIANKKNKNDLEFWFVHPTILISILLEPLQFGLSYFGFNSFNEMQHQLTFSTNRQICIDLSFKFPTVISTHDRDFLLWKVNLKTSISIQRKHCVTVRTRKMSVVTGRSVFVRIQDRVRSLGRLSAGSILDAAPVIAGGSIAKGSGRTRVFGVAFRLTNVSSN